jgi:hypothetical protein
MPSSNFCCAFYNFKQTQELPLFFRDIVTFLSAPQDATEAVLLDAMKAWMGREGHLCSLLTSALDGYE